jgi:hypothetical protein
VVAVGGGWWRLVAVGPAAAVLLHPAGSCGMSLMKQDESVGVVEPSQERPAGWR